MTLPGRMRLAELVASLSLATDLATGHAMEDGLRGCLTATRLGERLGLGEQDLADTYHLALTAFLGSTSGSHDAAAALGEELEVLAGVAGVDATGVRAVIRLMLIGGNAGRTPLHRVAALPRLMRATAMFRGGARAQCEVAQMLAARLGFEPRFQQHLAQVFERWDGRGKPAGLRGDAISVPARLSLLARQACVWARLHGVDTSLSMMRRGAGHSFDPEMAAAWEVHGRELLAALEHDLLWETVIAAEPSPRRWLNGEQIETACQAVADFADLKSPYTTGHSRGVARLAHDAALACGLSEIEAVEVRIAGYLHDVGRAGVSNDVWDKAASLTPPEWQRVRHHSRHTSRILARLDSLPASRTAAGLHHERLDGSGYHAGVGARDLPMGARLLAAADVYHALTETRPHRPPWLPAEAAATIESEVSAGRLDADAVSGVVHAAGVRRAPLHRSAPGGLTDPEIELLRLHARGMSNQQAGAELTISAGAVGDHLQRIYGKIDVSTRAAATLFALQNDLLGEPVPA